MKSPLRHGLAHTTKPNFVENNKEKFVGFLTLSESEPVVFRLLDILDVALYYCFNCPLGGAVT